MTTLSFALTRRPTREQIAERAHQIWLFEGCPRGREVQHWVMAEALLQAEIDSELRRRHAHQLRRRATETTPAERPEYLPDRVPVRTRRHSGMGAAAVMTMTAMA